jgi:hypothetical protein
MPHHGTVTETTQSAAASPPPTPPARGRAPQALGDMARSLGLMAVVVAGLLLLGPARTLVFPDDAKWQPVDYSSALRGFESVTGVAPLAPAGLPASWRANAGRVLAQDDGTAQLHVGWAVPGDRFAGLDETTGNGPALLRQVAGDGNVRAAGTTTVDGTVWQTTTSQRGEPVLFRRADGLTIVVTGDAGMAGLRLLAGSLHRAG